MPLAPTRDEVLNDPTLRGLALCEALSDRVDTWIRQLWEAHVSEIGSDTAVAAVGGYGRRELSPLSDLDVILVHPGRDDIGQVAEQLWYPIWDEGVKLGHAVRTPKEALALAKDDLDTATSLLSLRHIAGDHDLTIKLAQSGSDNWRRNSRIRLPQLADRVEERHHRFDEVAFMLEPDLKEGRGGLRDVHALMWAEGAERGVSLITADLRRAYEIMLAARVELHRATGRSSDQLLLEDQDAVAAALDYEDADHLMAEIATAARRIAWRSDEAWTELLRGLHRPRPWSRRRRDRDLGDGVRLLDGRVHLDPAFPVEPLTILRLAAAAARHEATFDRATLELLEGHVLQLPEPWPVELRGAFIDLLAAGRPAIPVVETLDQLGLFVPFLPEWEPSRSLPQRNRYHRFTVDRHLLESAAEAAALTHRVARPDLLLIGALLHDIGKPYPGDHTQIGMEMVVTIGSRMGFSPVDVDTLVDLVRHHLLLPDVATRRDIGDDDTLKSVAAQVGNTSTLELLAALTEADSIATGPAAWSSWKASLVRDLVLRTSHVLQGGDIGELPRNFPTPDQRQALRRGTHKIMGDADMLTLMTNDRPGVISRTAGALALQGLDVLEAAVHTEFGMALAMYRVEPQRRESVDWDVVLPEIERAIKGHVAIEARLQDRIDTYGTHRSAEAPLRLVDPRVLIDNELSSTATVVEIAARNGIGLLFRVTRALAGFDLDILRAKVQTLGDDVVDSFYVRDRDGHKLTDEQFLAELEKGLLHAIRTIGPVA